jgi:2-(3-amino-3-carboxypropyl)histidine synthase
MFEIDLENLLNIVNSKGYKKIGLQLPEGLKDRSIDFAKTIKKKGGCETFIFGDPCYGACGLADQEAGVLACDALFHFGHTEILEKTMVPVHYIEVKMKVDPIPILTKHIERLPEKIGLLTTIQHIHRLEKIQEILESAGRTVYIGKSRGRVAKAGQVLGCSFSSAKTISKDVDAFLYIGTGNFHPLGIALSTGKKTYSLDLEKRELRDMDKIREPILRKRFAKIALAKDSEDYGIIIGERPGQMRTALAEKIKKGLEEHDKKGYFICFREITPDGLLPFRTLDAFVNTACPRISIDDEGRYPKPILTPIELEIVLGNREWDDYQLDEIE